MMRWQCPKCLGTEYTVPSSLGRHVRHEHAVMPGSEDQWIDWQWELRRAAAARQAPSTPPPHSLLAPSTRAPQPPVSLLPQRLSSAAAAPAPSMPPPPPRPQSWSLPGLPPPLPPALELSRDPKRPRVTSPRPPLRVLQQPQHTIDAMDVEDAAAVAVAVAPLAAESTTAGAAVAAAVASSAPVPRPHSTGAVAAHGSASVAYSLASAVLMHWHRTGRIEPRDVAGLLDAFSVSNAHGLATFRAFRERMRPQP